MKNEDVRKLVSFKVVEKIKSIENADAIELVCFGGWQVVVKKDEFKVGDKVIYFEIDSFLPKGIKQFAFLVEKSSKKALESCFKNYSTSRSYLTRISFKSKRLR